MSKHEDRWPRVILHADMDAFYAAIEQLDHPELRGKPVLVGGPSRRGVVSTASYEARPFGCHSAMPMATAMRLCPHAIVMPPNFKRYEQVSGIVMKTLATFSPRIEPLSLDEAFLDMTGAEGLFGAPAEMGRRMKTAVKEATGGLTVSVGAAVTKFVAKVASDFQKPDGLTVVPPDRTIEFLWPLPVSRLWGVGPHTQARLERLGLRLIGEVARADEAMLARRFGESGRHLRQLALGIDDRDVEPEREAKSVGAELTLEHDITGANAVIPHLRGCAERVARHLRQDGLLAAGVRVKLKTAAFRLFTRQAPVTPPTDSERELERAAIALLDHFDLTVPMRLVGIAAFNLVEAGKRPVQQTLFDQESREKTRAIGHLVDRIRSKYGEKSVKWGLDGEKEDDQG